MTDVNTGDEEKVQLKSMHDVDADNEEVDLDDSKATFINHSANGGKGGGTDAVVVQVVEPAKEVDSSSDVSFVGLGKDELAKYADDPFYVRLRWILFILFWVAWVTMLVAAIVIIVLAPKCPHRPDLKWYNKNAVYKVYTKSFKDTDGDGVGDIKGVSAKLTYIESLGTKTLWLLGLYASEPHDDRAIINHTQITPMVGTLADLQALIKTAGKKEMKIMLDLIPNHTSRNHTWFKSSAKKMGKYADYYVWAGSDPSSPPNALKNQAGSSAWVYDDTRKQFYLAQVASNLPELNLSNPDVITEFEGIIGHWLGMGIGGFYVADVGHLLNNATPSDVTVVPMADPSTQKNYKTAGQGGSPSSLSVIQQLRAYIAANFDKPGRERFLMAAVDILNATVMESYFGNEEGRAIDLVANKAFMEKLNASCKAECMKKIIDEIPEASDQKWPVWMVGSDDVTRISNRVGDTLITAIFTIQMTMPGTAVVYYGDEIGMTSGTNPVGGSVKMEDNYRTPMQWTNKKGAGFSNSTKPWIPINADYTTINVQTENAHRSGHGQLETIMALSVLRTNESLQFGVKETYVYQDLLWMVRQAEGFPGFLVVINFGDKDTSYMFHQDGGVGAEKVKLVFNSAFTDALGSIYNIKERALAVKAGEAAVYKYV